MKRIRRIFALVAVLPLLPLAGAFAQGSGSSTPDLMWITWVGSIAALLFALYQAISVMRKDPGTSRCRRSARRSRKARWPT